MSLKTQAWPDDRALEWPKFKFCLESNRLLVIHIYRVVAAGGHCFRH